MTKEPSPCLIKNRPRVLKNIFSCAYAKGIIPHDPSAALVRPKSLTGDERRLLVPDETKD